LTIYWSKYKALQGGEVRVRTKLSYGCNKPVLKNRSKKHRGGTKFKTKFRFWRANEQAYHQQRILQEEYPFQKQAIQFTETDGGRLTLPAVYSKMELHTVV
jgi:hypothetical protein